jgi:hypothetical protein
MLQTFSRHLGLPTETSEILLSHSLKSLLNLPEVTQLLSSLNTALLKDSLPTAGAILAQHLPPFMIGSKPNSALSASPIAQTTRPNGSLAFWETRTA